MSEYRAPRTWHIEKRFGRFYVVNQFGGFEGWHDTREDAVNAGKMYVKQYGDKFWPGEPGELGDAQHSLLAALGAAIDTARKERQENNG